MKYRFVYDMPADEMGDITDTVEGHELPDGTVKLDSHATLIPVGPGDVVTVDGELVTGIHSLAPMFTTEVQFYLPADLPPFASPTPDHRGMKAVEATLGEWRTDAWVTRTTNFTALVSSPDLAWLREHVEGHRFVEHSEMVRTPATAINFNVAIKHPDLSGTKEGPWA